MTWADNLLPASFRDVEFDVVSTTDEARRSLARHSYPYTDGTDVEDMGRDERKFAMKAIIYGDNYEQHLQALLRVLDQRGPGRLIHPVFGVVEMAQVGSYRVHHDEDHVDYCAIDLEFEESITAAPFFVRLLGSQAADAVDYAADDAERASGSILRQECSQMVSRANGDLSVISRIGAMRRSAVAFLMAVNNDAREVLTSITDPISDAQGFVRDVTAMTQRLISMVPEKLEAMDYRAGVTRNAVNRLLPASSPTFTAQHTMAPTLGAISVANAAFVRVDRLLSSTALLPVVVSQDYAPPNYEAWVAANAASAQTAAAGGVPTSSLYPVPKAQQDADAQVLVVHIAAVRAVTKARIAANVLAAEAITPMSAPDQIEQIVTTVRESINEAIKLARQRYDIERARTITEPLKSLAMVVQEAGRAVINARPALVNRAVESDAPLRLLAHLWYGSHGRAQELQRLNNLRQPNAVTAGDILNAYSK